MCEPTTMILGASLALSAASAGASIMGQQAQAKQADAYNKQQSANALTARNANLGQLAVQEATDQRDLRETINRNTQAARGAQATALTAAGESGVAGLSVDALLRDLSGQAGLDNSTAVENNLRQSYQTDSQGVSVQNSYQSQINSLRGSQSPNYLGVGLQLGQSAMGSVGNYQDARLRQQSLAARQS